MRIGTTLGLLCLVLAGSASAQTIIIDNTDSAPAFVLTGNDWTTWGSLGYGFDSGDSDYHYLSHTVGGPDRRGTATWTPDLPTAGLWEITTWWRRTENRTDDADHFITDGAGNVTHVVLDQRGTGASGWVLLGQFDCDAGLGGCSVELDGTDDDQSDAANAVRFQLITAAPPGDDDDAASGPCEAQAPGTWVQESWAGTVTGADWTSMGAAVGAPDGAEAQTPNVDAGEFLRGSGFTLCDPDGDETITGVELEVRARTQYSSGPYALNLELHGGGAASALFTGTNLAWRTVDVTGDVAAWTWGAAEALAATVQLGSQPGGNRDSDAWVDAFRLRVTYEVPAPPPPVGDDDDATEPVGDDDDATEPVGDDDDATEPVGDDDDSGAEPPTGDDDDAVGTLVPGDEPGPPPSAGGCAQTLDSGASWSLLGLLWVGAGLGGRRRRAEGRGSR